MRCSSLLPAGAEDDVVQPHGLGHPQAGQRWWPGRPGGKKASPARWCPESRCRPRSPGAGSGCGGPVPRPGARRFPPPAAGVPRGKAFPTPGARPRRIIRRGTGLMAGSPTATANPGLVTRPTPSPPRRMISSSPPGDSRRQTRAPISAPLVTSGSSPASLITTASPRAPCLPWRMQRDGEAAAAGQSHLDLIRAGQPQQLVQRPLGRSRGGGAGGKALAQFLPGPGGPGVSVRIGD